MYKEGDRVIFYGHPSMKYSSNDTGTVKALDGSTRAWVIYDNEATAKALSSDIKCLRKITKLEQVMK